MGKSESNIGTGVTRRACTDISGVTEPGMLTNDYMATRETLRLFITEYSLGKVMEYGEQPIKRENAKEVRRESDSCIVPEKPM